MTTTDTYDTRGDGSFATALVTPAQTQVAANRRIDPDRHQPFTDEILLGYRRQLPGQIGVDATFIRRAYKDMPAQIDVNGIYTGGVFRGYEDVSQNAILLQTNNVWNTPIYTGVEVVGSQRTRRSQFIVGYTRGFQHLDGTWQPNDPASFIQPTAFANDRGIGSIRGNENNSLSGTAQARNPMWIKHALRLAGSYNAPWGLTLSSNLNIFSGPYTGPIVSILPAPDPQFGPATLVLSNGRTVSNPLATTVRFAYASRGEGQLQAPTLAQWNARVGRRFALGNRRFEIALSLLNITNRDALQEYLGGKQSDRQSEFRVRARRHVPRPESPGRSARRSCRCSSSSRRRSPRALTSMPKAGMIMPILGVKAVSSRSRGRSLADALFTKTQQRVLGVLFGQPERSFYASELIRDAGTGSGAAQRELARLEASGLIVARRIGHQKHYQANAASPLYSELRNIVLKTVGLAEPLRDALKPLSKAIRAAFVYGSVAKATDQSASDIDLMIISDSLTYSDVFGVLERVTRAVGRKVNPTVYTAAEFSKRARTADAFVTRVIEQPKLWVIGSEHDLPIAA